MKWEVKDFWILGHSKEILKFSLKKPNKFKYSKEYDNGAPQTGVLKYDWISLWKITMEFF